MEAGQAADDPFPAQLLQALQGEDDVQIPLGVAMIVIIVGDAEIAADGHAVEFAKEGSPFRSTMSKGCCPAWCTPAVVTTATLQAPSGLPGGAQGIAPALGSG